MRRGNASPVLRTTGLGCTIGGAVIVEDVSLEVAEGEFVAVIGPNGAGKTSLFNLVSGLLAATSGRIELDGTDITGASVEGRARRGIGRTFQASSVFPALTVRENARLAARAKLGGSLRVWLPARRDAEALRGADSVLERVGLARRAGRTAGELSHGDKRKLELALLLATDPRLLLLDEPMAGMSAEDVPGLTELIRSVHREEGRTVLMVEHHMEVLLGLADRVAVMHHGSLLAIGPPDEVVADATVQSAYLGAGL